jgi:hypothetical protein
VRCEDAPGVRGRLSYRDRDDWPPPGIGVYSSGGKRLATVLRDTILSPSFFLARQRRDLILALKRCCFAELRQARKGRGRAIPRRTVMCGP